MIDTHTHIYGPEFDIEGQAAGSLEGQCAAVDRAVAAGVELMMFANVDRESIEPIRKLHELRPDNTLISMGLHPTELKEDWKETIEEMMNLIAANPGLYKAVGEIGMDLYWEKESLPRQLEAFDIQLAKAEEFGLPVLIHSRDALAETLEVLSGHKGVKAVFHSFGGTEADVDAIRRVGDYYFGINGIVTFKNSGLKSVLPHIGIDRILTETDSPYLTPVPYRGKRNETALMPLVADAIADGMGLDIAEVRKATTENAKKFLNIQI
ncbi:MAG: TatD family hydrolase [Bacteroidales bacterium]|nr:TatD family hydrolase [Bacteroidales bacterium]